MIIKLITQPNLGVDSIEQFRLVDNVQSVTVRDFWTDGSGGDLCENNAHLTIAYTGDEKYKSYHWLSFECKLDDGSLYYIDTAMPVFVMNDKGKTIETLYPSHKNE